MRIERDSSRLAWVVGICFALLISLLIATPRGRSFLVANAAQLLRLHGEDPVDLYAQLLNLAPESRHARFLVASFYTRSGNDEIAAEILGQLSIQDANMLEQLVMIISFAGSGEVDRALTVYKDSDLASYIPRGIALRMLDAALFNSEMLLSKDEMFDLFARSFGLDQSARAHTYFEERFTVPGVLDGLSAYGDRWKWRVATPRTLSIYDSSSQVDCIFSEDALKRTVAEMIGFDSDRVELSPDLSINGDFEDFDFWEDRLVGWETSFMSTGDPWSFGLFVLGSDWGGCNSGKRLGRVDGLYIERSADREPARAGLWHPSFAVPAMTPYLITFVYRTRGSDDPLASIYLTDSADVFDKRELILPATNAEWRRAIILAWNQSPSSERVYPLLRLYGEGSVQFDNFAAYWIKMDYKHAPAQSLLRITSP